MALGRLTLTGDRQVDFRHHGGEDKAVYAYPWEHYAVWEEELGRDDLVYGQFGENFTVTGLVEDAVFIGDSPHDVAAGHAAGVRTAAALWGPFRREEIARQEPDFWLDHPKEIAGLSRH